MTVYVNGFFPRKYILSASLQTCNKENYTVVKIRLELGRVIEFYEGPACFSYFDFKELSLGDPSFP